MEAIAGNTKKFKKECEGRSLKRQFFNPKKNALIIQCDPHSIPSREASTDDNKSFGDPISPRKAVYSKLRLGKKANHNDLLQSINEEKKQLEAALANKEITANLSFNNDFNSCKQSIFDSRICLDKLKGNQQQLIKPLKAFSTARKKFFRGTLTDSSLQQPNHQMSNDIKRISKERKTDRKQHQYNKSLKCVGYSKLKRTIILRNQRVRGSRQKAHCLDLQSLSPSKNLCLKLNKFAQKSRSPKRYQPKRNLTKQIQLQKIALKNPKPHQKPTKILCTTLLFNEYIKSPNPQNPSKSSQKHLSNPLTLSQPSSSLIQTRPFHSTHRKPFLPSHSDFSQQTPNKSLVLSVPISLTAHPKISGRRGKWVDGERGEKRSTQCKRGSKQDRTLATSRHDTSLNKDLYNFIFP
ncbi:unnamed protein product [Moneuplotes crassus]|uniref:Uncharacterized protein n=1 Tax=Euplotes crassus TaxID=5936 RepID=A0AAD1UB95_EUPCR|nr:unnamed protein product [Moneuplotes crassus]